MRWCTPSKLCTVKPNPHGRVMKGREVGMSSRLLGRRAAGMAAFASLGMKSNKMIQGVDDLSCFWNAWPCLWAEQHAGDRV